MKKEESTATTQPEVERSNDSSLGIVSLVLGIISLTGPGLVLGIPAIITGAIALKKKQGDRGLSITGLVTGSVSTVISLLVIALFIFFFIWGLNHPDTMRELERQQQQGAQPHPMIYERS